MKLTFIPCNCCIIRQSTSLYMNKMRDIDAAESTDKENNTYTEICVWENVEYSFVSHFPNDLYRGNHVLCLIYNIIQTFLIIVLNYAAIQAFYKSSQLRRKTTFFIVMVLSANDLVIGLVVEPLFLIHLGREISGNENCFVFLSFVVTNRLVLSFSMITFLALNFEIYLSVIYPIFHKTKVTNRRILYLLIVLWSLFIINQYLFVFIFSKNTVPLILTSTMTFAILALVFMHVRIFVTVYKRRKIEPNVQGEKTLLRRVRDAKSCIAVLLCTICCYLPSSIGVGLNELNLETAALLFPWSNTVILSASVFNSVIFYWRNPILRKQTKSILRSFSF